MENQGTVTVRPLKNSKRSPRKSKLSLREEVELTTKVVLRKMRKVVSHLKVEAIAVGIVVCINLLIH